MRISDWSSDVCSSDLAHRALWRRNGRACPAGSTARNAGSSQSGADNDGPSRNPHPCDRASSSARLRQDRKSVVSGKSVSVRVDLGGRRIIKNKKRIKKESTTRDQYKTQKKKRT